jgi:hypothetical protein
MVFEFFDKINGFSESINIQLLLTTLLFMIMGFIYFIFRIRRLSQPLNIEENNANNYNQNINNNQSNYQSNNINNNINNNVRTFHIVIQIERDRHNFDIRITDNIGQFIREKIYPLTNNRNVYLFYQGQLLNQSQPFSFYEHRITENMVILCNVRENNNNNGRLNNNHYDDNIREREQEQLRNDPRSVSIYSILTHFFIIIILGFIIFSYKTFEEIFTKQTKRMIQFLCIIWALTFSNSASKLIFYKKISY